MNTIKLLTVGFLFLLQGGIASAADNADVLAKLYAADMAKPLQLIVKSRLAQTDPAVAELFSQRLLDQFHSYLVGTYRSSYSEIGLRQIVDFMTTAAGEKFRSVNANTAFAMATEPARMRQMIVASCASAEATLSSEQMTLLRATFCK